MHKTQLYLKSPIVKVHEKKKKNRMKFVSPKQFIK